MISMDKGLMAETYQGPPEAFAGTLHFGYTSPPLTANQRMHWRKKASITKDVRRATSLAAARYPALGKCRVTLTWLVVTNHRRDADNVVPTLKAMCDGLVDAGVVTDDTPDQMDKLMPRIVKLGAGEGPARFELRVERIS
jgi:Holliday junction resolvase RusA-like endonuclease